MTAVTELAKSMPIERACDGLGVARGSYYRAQSDARAPQGEPRPRPAPAWALSPEERGAVRELLNTEFVDLTPYTAYTTLLDRDEYLCSTSTMYRILEEEDEVRERRRQSRHPKRAKPRLRATGPNQVWSWDITKLRGVNKGESYFLYTILDIFSRYVVGWMLADREGEDLACQLIGESCRKEGIVADSLTIHSDRGSVMTATSTAKLMERLGVAKSHSRPRVPDDNPFIEAHYKTFKYQPDFPGTFDGIEAARLYCQRFVHWYNTIHYHSGIAYLTPLSVHTGQFEAVRNKRQAALDKAFAAHPTRFTHGRPLAPSPPTQVWINQPALEVTDSAEPEATNSSPHDSDPAVARDAPTQAHSPDAQAGSTAAEGRAQRSVDAGEHPATLAASVSTQTPRRMVPQPVAAH